MFQPKHTYVEISFIISNRKSYQNAIKGKTDESGHSISNKLHVRPAKTRVSLPIHAVFTTCLKTFSILDYPQNALWRLWSCRLVENAVPLLWHKRFIIWDHLQTLILKSQKLLVNKIVSADFNTKSLPSAVTIYHEITSACLGRESNDRDRCFDNNQSRYAKNCILRFNVCGVRLCIRIANSYFQRRHACHINFRYLG